MGYRSCAAIALYGNPQQVDMVDAMLLQKLDPEYYRELWERQKQVQDKVNQKYGTTRFIVWTFDDIKWYSDLDGYKDDLFRWVDGINEERKEGDEMELLCVEFVRTGEQSDDTEEQYSDEADYVLYVTRSIELPYNFKWRC